MDERSVAVITGAGRPWSLGRACALKLAASGVAIAVVDVRDDWGRETAAMVSAQHGVASRFISADVSQRDAVARVAHEVAESFGGVDILINSAAVVENRALPDITDDHFDRIMGINLQGTILTCQALAPLMRRRDGGKIINVASGAAVRPLRTAGVYSASKAAVVAFSRVLALELADEGTVVCVVAPGTLGNAMGSEQGPQSQSDVGSDSLAASLPPQPFGSMPTADQVAELITYLATADSTLLAGQTLHANAGAWMV